MKKLSFYWNWLARVAKASNTQRKMAILAIVAAAILLVPQTSGPTAQSTGTPNLPEPPPHREVVLPPFPPGMFNNCLEQYYSRLGTIAQGDRNMRKRIEDVFNPKFDRINALIAARLKLMNDLEAEIRSIETSPAYYAAYVGIGDLQPLLDKINRLEDDIQDVWNQLRKLREEKSSLLNLEAKWIDWLNEKTQREVNAAWEEYENCADSETNND